MYEHVWNVDTLLQNDDVLNKILNVEYRPWPKLKPGTAISPLWSSITTPTHTTAFILVVNDFFIRYSHPYELDHLVSNTIPISAIPSLTIPPSLPCMTLTMPNYIPLMLSQLCPSSPGSASSPAAYSLPSSLLEPCHTTFDPLPIHSPTVSPAIKTWIQQAVRSLFFFA